MRERLARTGIETGYYYRVPLHCHPAFADWLTSEGQLPISEQLADEVFSLPLHAALSNDDVHHVLRAVD